MPKEWEKEFPNLGKWTCTSKRTREYNCLAFAVGDEARRWEPLGGFYWPDGATKGYSAECLIEAYQTKGFEVCADGALVEGYEKVVIYLNDQAGFLHAARQEPNGRWKSKLGDEEDIEHESPESLTSNVYGKPRVFMQRARKQQAEEKKEAEASTTSASSEPAAPEAGVANPMHREDFTALLNAAAQKREPKD
jgi:hypothetical protein